MSEIKQTTFRLNEDDVNTFREMTEKHGMNQAEMFQGLLNAFEMAKAKNQLGDRGKEIDTFQTTVNTLVNMFLNSLAINQTSEERIREALSLELTTKDNTIKDLQEEKQKFKDEIAALKESLDIKSKTAKEAELALNKVDKDTSIQIEKLNNDLSEKSDVIISLQDQIQTLNSIISEYKGYKDNYSSLEAEIKDLNKTIGELTTTNKDINLKLENESKMKEFYEKEVKELKSSIEKINNENKTLDQQHKQELESLVQGHRQELKAVEQEHQEVINKETEKLSKNFEDKLQLEKDRLELTKSKNEAELESIKDKFNTLKEKYDSLLKDTEKKTTAPKTTRKKKEEPIKE